MEKTFQILLIILLLQMDIFSQTNSVNIIKTQSINFGDIFGQLSAGAVGGSITSLLGGAIAVGIANMNDERGWGSLGYVAIGMVAGYTIGNTFGVYLAANKTKYNPNFYKLLLTSTISMIVGLVILSQSNQDGVCFGCYSPIFLPPLATVLALNVFERKSDSIDMVMGLNKITESNKQNLALQFRYNF